MINSGKSPGGKLIEELMAFLKEKGFLLEDLRKLLNQDTFLQAWNYTEIKQDKYSFKELLAWVKEHFNPNLHSAASLTKEEKAGEGLILSCCFMDKKNAPLTSEKDPFLRVMTKELDEDLKKNFGNKDMIMLK
ncbi:hypothetical protein HBZC1_11250 [Helicobacter bizzozeronii CIII-1]|uniref:Uncharacterized protein n=1 Tax=Helicobacter bizzozeronii (strain CIII-1) TaxID=1002804 RepID=F8KTF7_HELBC|nr:hypothetical protein [Helicobacter bizzozeronii]CCB80111.1 hypothetical protein HBZC1_11250 [Helicobacter bizzozeronii CIII-1]